MQIKTAQQLKDIIAPIPEDRFLIGRTGNHTPEDGMSCFIGHVNRACNREGRLLGIIPVNNPNFTGSNSSLKGYGAIELTMRFLQEVHKIPYNSGVTVNDARNVNGYTEPKIKDRLMHMIEDMISHGY